MRTLTFNIGLGPLGGYLVKNKYIVQYAIVRELRSVYIHTSWYHVLWFVDLLHSCLQYLTSARCFFFFNMLAGNDQTFTVFCVQCKDIYVSYHWWPWNVCSSANSCSKSVSVSEFSCSEFVLLTIDPDMYCIFGAFLLVIS